MQVTQRDDVVPLSVDTQPFLPRSAKPSEPDLELLLSPTESFTPSRGGSPKPVRLKSNFGPSALAQFVLSVPWAAALALPVAEEESVVEQINTAISECVSLYDFFTYAHGAYVSLLGYVSLSLHAVNPVSYKLQVCKGCAISARLCSWLVFIIVFMLRLS